MSVNIPASGNPLIAIDKITSDFRRLAANLMVVLEFIAAMIILMKLPPNYSSVSDNIVMDGTVANVTVSTVHEHVLAIFENHIAKAKLKTEVKKISTVKQKNPDPSFQQQQQQQSQSGPSRTHRRGRGQRKPKVQVATDYSNDGSEQIHIALVATFVPTVW